MPGSTTRLYKSPSSRRAWIEIVTSTWSTATRSVALLAEGVDRNWLDFRDAILAHSSPSSRRAWIEILPLVPRSEQESVALLAEGVDRNSFGMWQYTSTASVALLAEGVDRNYFGFSTTPF